MNFGSRKEALERHLDPHTVAPTDPDTKHTPRYILNWIKKFRPFKKVVRKQAPTFLEIQRFLLTEAESLVLNPGTLREMLVEADIVTGTKRGSDYRVFAMVCKHSSLDELLLPENVNIIDPVTKHSLVAKGFVGVGLGMHIFKSDAIFEGLSKQPNFTFYSADMDTIRKFEEFIDGE